MTTLVLRLPVADPASNKSFEERLKSLCNVQAAAGYEVKAIFSMGLDMVIVFQSRT